MQYCIIVYLRYKVTTIIGLTKGTFPSPIETLFKPRVERKLKKGYNTSVLYLVIMVTPKDNIIRFQHNFYVGLGFCFLYQGHSYITDYI